MVLPVLPSLDKSTNKKESTHSQTQVKIDDLPSLKFTQKDNTLDNKKKTKYEDTRLAIQKKISLSRRGTSEMAEIIDSKILFMAPEDFFNKYTESIQEITSWIQNKMSESVEAVSYTHL